MRKLQIHFTLSHYEVLEIEVSENTTKKEIIKTAENKVDEAIGAQIFTPERIEIFEGAKLFIDEGKF